MILINRFVPYSGVNEMLTKLVEVHDDTITVRVLAVKLTPANDEERKVLFEHHGYSQDGSSVMLIELENEAATTDPMQWPSIGVHPRTLPVAHDYIKRNFERLPSDQVKVINVAEILGADLDPLLPPPFDLDN